MLLFTLQDCDLIKKCSRTQKKSHRVNGALVTLRQLCGKYLSVQKATIKK